MNNPNENRKTAAQRGFSRSLAQWGGWSKLSTGFPLAHGESVSKSVDRIASALKKKPSTIGKLTPSQWDPIAEVVPLFLNVYLEQELDRIFDQHGDVHTFLRLVHNQWYGQLVMALVIVARELRMNVVVTYRCPFGAQNHNDHCPLGSGLWSSTLEISIRHRQADEELPLVLRYHGEKSMLDEIESAPGNPVHAPVKVDQRLAVFLDGSDYFETIQQHDKDTFLRGQGFLVVRYSPQHVEKDLFACAAEVVKAVTGESLPPPN